MLIFLLIRDFLVFQLLIEYLQLFFLTLNLGLCLLQIVVFVTNLPFKLRDQIFLVFLLIIQSV